MFTTFSSAFTQSMAQSLGAMAGKAVVKTAGFAREELVLGAMVLGGVGAFGGLVAIPWSGILAGGTTEAVALYKQIEAANLKFYQDHGYWPHEATDGNPAANVVVLMDRKAATQAYLSQSGFRPLIQADMDVTETGQVVRHRYGAGGAVRQMAVQDGTDADFRYIISMDNLSKAEARELDEKVDGKFNPNAGRLQITYLGDKAIARYFANPRLKEISALRD